MDHGTLHGILPRRTYAHHTCFAALSPAVRCTGKPISIMPTTYFLCARAQCKVLCPSSRLQPPRLKITATFCGIDGAAHQPPGRFAADH
ncbi:hypothetical protein V8C42DRAFT_312536 [Trichoderma barbatum]